LRAGSKALALILALAAPVHADPVTVLAFGDSLTQGYGLPQAEGFAPVLEDWLQEQGADATVINGGVSGDTTAGGAGRIAWSLTDDIDAVIVALGGNDLLRGVAPEATRENLDRIVTETTTRGLPTLLVGMQAAANYGEDYKAAFDAIYPALAEKHHVALFPSFLLALEEIEDREAVLRDFLQSDAIHPNAAGVERIVERMGPAVLALITEP